jgi:hypothetical protein
MTMRSPCTRGPWRSARPSWDLATQITSLNNLAVLFEKQGKYGDADFGISLNCRFGTDKAARHGGYRAAQPPSPTAPVGTCWHLHVPVGTCRHRCRYPQCRHETDRRQPIGTEQPYGCRRRLAVGIRFGTNFGCMPTVCGTIDYTDQAVSVRTLDT